MSLNDIQREIYSRQIMMSEIGEEGQERLADASVLVVGCGGLGAPVLNYLAAAGIGHIGVCDGDTVSLSDLNRQILFSRDDTGKSKAGLVAEHLRELNPGLTVTVYDRFLDDELAGEIIAGFDIAIDCLDNLKARIILNDACIRAGKAFIHAGVGEFYGQLMTIVPGEGPCLRCLFPGGARSETVEKAGPAGIIGVTPGVLGAMQVTEAIKLLLGMPVNKGLVLYDGLELTADKVEINQSEECVCFRSEKKYEKN